MGYDAGHDGIWRLLWASDLIWIKSLWPPVTQAHLNTLTLSHKEPLKGGLWPILCLGLYFKNKVLGKCCYWWVSIIGGKKHKTKKQLKDQRKRVQCTNIKQISNTRQLNKLGGKNCINSKIFTAEELGMWMLTAPWLERKQCHLTCMLRL